MTHLAMLGALALAAAACGGTSAVGAAAVPTGPTEAPASTRAPDPDVPVRVADTGPQVQIVNEPGKMVALEDVLVPGKVTVVDFYADWCGACKVMEAKLVEQIKDEPRIVVRKINIEDDTSEVAKHYDVGVLPHFRIYKPDGELAYLLVGNECLRSAELAFESLPTEQ